MRQRASGFSTMKGNTALLAAWHTNVYEPQIRGLIGYVHHQRVKEPQPPGCRCMVQTAGLTVAGLGCRKVMELPRAEERVWSVGCRV